ncbi:MAG: hypothetical protein NVS1B11_21220 [Terriglobales bacterium]
MLVSMLGCTTPALFSDNAELVPLAKVADVPLPGPAVRFDYQSFDRSSGRLYIAHMNADQLVVFDTQKRVVVANLDGFPNVHGVWAVPELGRVYASATGDHKVTVLDMQTLKTIARVGPVEYPDGIAYAPDAKRVFVSDEHGNADVVIDATTNSLITAIITTADQTGPTTGGNMVNFSGSNTAFIASALRTDEVDHVKYLRAALGSAAVKKPTINLSALGYGYANVDDFLKLGRQFEDVGVSAYLGAAPLITSKAYLDAAARIMDTEAQHSGAVRLLCIQNGVNSPAVDGKDVPPTQQKPFDVDSNALSIPRSTSEVLHIVYGGGTTSGGFYPNGMNGNIK